MSPVFTVFRTVFTMRLCEFFTTMRAVALPAQGAVSLTTKRSFAVRRRTTLAEYGARVVGRRVSILTVKDFAASVLPARSTDQ